MKSSMQILKLWLLFKVLWCISEFQSLYLIAHVDRNNLIFVFVETHRSNIALWSRVITYLRLQELVGSIMRLGQLVGPDETVFTTDNQRFCGGPNAIQSIIEGRIC